LGDTKTECAQRYTPAGSSAELLNMLCSTKEAQKSTESTKFRKENREIGHKLPDIGYWRASRSVQPTPRQHEGARDDRLPRGRFQRDATVGAMLSSIILTDHRRCL
jgi:hypothetical protein